MMLAFVFGRSGRFLGFFQLILCILCSPVSQAFDLPPQEVSNGVVINGTSEVLLSDIEITGIGDINGDTRDDFAIATPKHDNVYVLYGKAQGNAWPGNIGLASLIANDASTGFIFQGPVADLAAQENQRTGRAIAGGCDINHDGLSDIIIAVPGARVVRPLDTVPVSRQAGKIYVIYGNANIPKQLDASQIEDSNAWGFVIKGVDDAHFAGISVACLKDINGDSFDDILIGSRVYVADDYNALTFESAGQAYVVYGKASATDPNSVYEVDLREDILNFPDPANPSGENGFIIEAPRFQCVSDVVDGKDVSAAEHCGGTVHADVNTPIDRPSDFGLQLVGLDDMNGDGIPDFAIAAPKASPNGVATENGNKETGQVYVLFGRNSAFPATVNIQDILAGNGSMGFAVNGVNYLAHIGSSMTSEDVNNDSLADLIINEPEQTFANKFGRVYAVFGRPLQQSFEPVLSLADLAVGDSAGNAVIGMRIDGKEGEFGKQLAALGDINADGLKDVVMGAPTLRATGSGEGGALVMFGRESKDRVFKAQFDVSHFGEVDNEYGFVIYGDNNSDHAGKKVAGLGDINGDGIADMAVAAPDVVVGVNTPAIGRLYLLFGSDQIAGIEVRPEEHNKSPIKEIPAIDDTLPQKGTGNGFGLLFLLLGLLLVRQIVRNRV